VSHHHLDSNTNACVYPCKCECARESLSLSLSVSLSLTHTQIHTYTHTFDPCNIEPHDLHNVGADWSRAEARGSTPSGAGAHTVTAAAVKPSGSARRYQQCVRMCVCV